MSSREVPVLQILDHFGISHGEEAGETKFLCPFHEERTPSCGFELSTGRWYCFGCGEGGQMMRFVEMMLRATGQVNGVGVGVQALRLIRSLRQKPVETEHDDVDEKPRKGLQELPYDVNVAWSRFHRVSWETASRANPAVAYLLDRGFRRGTLAAFDIRLTERDGYPIVIPIRMDDKLVGYVYRRIDKSEDKKKYLYNFGLNADSVLSYYRVGASMPVIVEGVLDLMMVAQHGYPHCAAMLSWHTSDVKAYWLRAQGVSDVVSALDNTPTGRRGTARLREFFGVYRLKFPGRHRKDVGELSKHEFVKGVREAFDNTTQSGEGVVHGG